MFLRLHRQMRQAAGNAGRRCGGVRLPQDEHERSDRRRNRRGSRKKPYFHAIAWRGDELAVERSEKTRSLAANVQLVAARAVGLHSGAQRFGERLERSRFARTDWANVEVAAKVPNLGAAQATIAQSFDFEQPRTGGFGAHG